MLGRGQHLVADVRGGETGHRAEGREDRAVVSVAEDDAETGLLLGVNPAATDVHVAPTKLLEHEPARERRHPHSDIGHAHPEAGGPAGADRARGADRDTPASTRLSTWP